MSTQFVEDIKKPNIVVEVVEAIDKKFSEDYDDTKDILAKFIDISDDAKKSDQREKDMTLKEGLKLFPKAACWSLILSTAVVMEGFDLQVVGGLTAFPSFREKYGKYYPKIDQYQIPVFYSNIFGPCGNIAQVIGLLFAGIMTDRYGYKKTISGFMLLLVALVFIEVFSTNYVTLLIGSLLLSIPFGAFQTLTVSYAADVCPQVLKIYLTTYVNACWVIGQLLGSAVLKGLLADDSLGQWQYKIPFLLQWFWPFPILTALWFCPESPWYLVKKGRNADEKSPS